MAVRPIPEGQSGATPYLCVSSAAAAIEFYKKAFGATELGRLVGPDGRVGHAEVKIGEARIMLADEFPEMGILSPKSLGSARPPVQIHLYVEDVDAFYKRALQAGAVSLREPADQFYGDRNAQLQDPSGHVWYISTHKEDVSLEEMKRRFEALEETGLTPMRLADREAASLPEADLLAANTSPTAAPAPGRAAISFIFVTVVLDMLALGMIVPVLPKLVEYFLSGNTARAAEIFGLFGTVWALMQFLFSPVLGSLSDRYGRRPVILLSNFGLGLDYILMAMAPTLWWLFVGRVISGITSATFSTASAYIADVAPPEKRAGGFGLLSAAFGLGFVLGPALGGVLGSFGPRLPFWVAAGLSLTNAMYGLFVLPESLPAERRAGFAWAQANPVGSLALLRSDVELLGLGIVNFVGNIAHEALPTTFVLYASYRYGWDGRAVGLTIAVVGLCSAVVGAGLVQPAVTRFGERSVVLMGLLFGVTGFSIYGLAASGAVFFTGVPVQALWGLYGPPMQGIMTRRVKPSEQGQLQGALGSLRGIAFMIGPMLFTLTFASFISARRDWHLPGAPFLLAALLLAAAMVLAWRATDRTATEVEAF